jgi:dihydroxyacetone kinase-like protein
MAAEMHGGHQATVLVNDDVAVEDSLYTTGRRGVAGTVVVEKIVGAAAEAGAGLEALAALGRRVNGQTRSMGAALTSCTVPAAGRPTFGLADDVMELGVGIHGEPGRQQVPLQPADGIAEALIEPITADLAAPAGREVLLLVNGFGGTPLMELYVVHRAARRLLEGRGLSVARALVGNYCTALDMAGCSLTVTLLDDELKRLWDAPVRTAALSW